VEATGTAPLSYQWYQGTSPSTTIPIAGATTSSYTTPALTSTTSYWVRVTNAYGTANSVTATITITAGGANNNPIANPDAVTVLVNSTATPIPVLANDSTAPDVGETLTVTAVTQSVNGGTVARITTGINAGKVSYRPKANFVGIDTFTYTISDGRGGVATATVTVTVASSGGES
jgi:hypothetical protein